MEATQAQELMERPTQVAVAEVRVIQAQVVQVVLE
jgi:hypothetical protein